jgi:glycosyltransferase involved in cell wall biosynthesis
MYCGACFRDNALVAALRQMGHEVTMLPLYLPLTLDEADATQGAPIFYSGINVYLQQKSAVFRFAPNWFHRLFASRRLLDLVAGSAASTQPADVGELTISMLKGENGLQARELQELITWLKPERPDVVSLSNALLVGMARQIKRELNVPVICSLQGEDIFLNALPDGIRERAWDITAERAADVDLFIAPSNYFANFMRERLRIPANKIRVVYNGINMDGYSAADLAIETQPITLGFFARMCREKGMHTLVDAFIELRRRGSVPNLKLKIGGSCGPTDQKVVDEQKQKLRDAGLEGSVEFHPNLAREQKLQFLHSLTLFSVPAMYGEAFGLYIIEALAAGVPVIQPRHSAFPELMEKTGGGMLYDPTKPGALTDAILELALDQKKARELGETGRNAVFQSFEVKHMALNVANVLAEVTRVSSRKS